MNRIALSVRRRHGQPFIHKTALYVCVACLWSGLTASVAAQTVTIHTSTKALQGYTLLPLSQSKAGLIDMQGMTIQSWELSGFPVKMVPGGSVIGLVSSTTPHVAGSGVAQLSWDGSLEWEYEGEAHHDFQREGNPVGYYAPGQDPLSSSGKTLILIKKTKTVESVSSKELQDDEIIELDWSGKSTGFHWKAADHIDEMGFDRRALRRISRKGGDWLHVNCASYVGPNRWYDGGDSRFHPDNVIFDSRNANFQAIISYRTGKIVWRVGPDYSAGTPEGDNLGQIVGQHHTHVIPEGLPGAGNVLLFDNGGRAGYPTKTRDFSRVIEYDPTTLKLAWEYKDPGNFYSSFISSAQRLTNGNTLITEGAEGRIFEVTESGEIVWECTTDNSQLYRSYRIPPEWVPGDPSGYTNGATKSISGSRKAMGATGICSPGRSLPGRAGMRGARPAIYDLRGKRIRNQPLGTEPGNGGPFVTPAAPELRRIVVE